MKTSYMPQSPPFQVEGTGSLFCPVAFGGGALFKPWGPDYHIIVALILIHLIRNLSLSIQGSRNHLEVHGLK